MTLEELCQARSERRLTKEERARYCALRKESGLSKKQFCAREGLVWPTFISWFSTAAKAAPSEASEVGFVPIQVLRKEPSTSNECKSLV